MAQISFNNVGISALSGCVPKNIVRYSDYYELYTPDEVDEIVNKTGIIERRFVDNNTCSSDLCQAAAEQLFSGNQVNRLEIDLLVFVSQTPDYRMPATSVLLQDRLGLSKQTMTLDINIGCSGFIYGLSVVYALMEKSGFRMALLLDGETRSKVYSPKDRKAAFLFGDAGVAALIERNEKFGKSWFSLNSDGSREDLIKIKAGGYRNPSSCDTVQEKVVDEYGNIRSDEQGSINGSDVFNFVLKEIPKDIKYILESSEIDKEAIDYFVLHQANNFINNYLHKKLKLDQSKLPSTIAKFGNTSSVSIPITIVSELKNQLINRKKLLLSGFGVGMSWASAIINVEDCRIMDLIEI